MAFLSPLFMLLHLLGLALAIGAASVKLLLLARSAADPVLVSAYVDVVRPITRVIVLGLVLLTLSGLGWLFVVGGYAYTPRLIAKLAAVAAIWGLGPVIDNFAEPRYLRLAPSEGQTASAQFLSARRRYLAFEALATGLFYAIAIFWILL